MGLEFSLVFPSHALHLCLDFVPQLLFPVRLIIRFSVHFSIRDHFLSPRFSDGVFFCRSFRSRPVERPGQALTVGVVTPCAFPFVTPRVPSEFPAIWAAVRYHQKYKRSRFEQVEMAYYCPSQVGTDNFGGGGKVSLCFISFTFFSCFLIFFQMQMTFLRISSPRPLLLSVRTSFHCKFVPILV